MPINEIKGTLEALATGISEDAKAFGFSPRSLAERLRYVAVHYIVSLNEHEESHTRGKVLSDLAHVTDSQAAGIGRRTGVLDGEALDAALGLYPNAGIRLHGSEGRADVYVPRRSDLEVSAIKKMAAVRARSGLPVVFKVEGIRTGLERLWAPDPVEARARLRAAADAEPQLVKEALEREKQVLEKTFQVDTGKGGRNLKVTSGLNVPPDWRLMNDILNVIWPIDNGQLHSHRMERVRNIVDQVILYIHHTDGDQENRARVNSHGLITIGNYDHEARETTTHKRREFDTGWLSSIMTYRHQINTLRRAVQFIEERKLELERAALKLDDNRARLERIDRVAFYPLLDWRRELERRLSEADYRTGDEKVRRVTGEVFRIPEVPKLKKGMPQAVIALKLVRAWKNYSAKKIPPNKGRIAGNQPPA